MTTVAAKTRYSPDDLLQMADGDDFELVNGELVELNMGYKSGYISTQIAALLFLFSREHGLGWVANSDAGFQCFPDDPDRVRKPDITFIRRERLAAPPKGHCTIPPDLAVEVISPNDLFSKVVEKVHEYLAAGVGLVWVVDPDSSVILAYGGDGSVTEFGKNDELTAGDVLPGFRVAVAEIFKTPSTMS